MTNLFKVAAVPEHFSLPLNNVNIKKIEHPRGTGSMCRSLKNKDVDVIIALSEGLVTDKINNDSDLVIISTYVTSKLTWGNVVKYDSEIATYDDLKDREIKVGISRFGSGSHVMTNILAKSRNLDVKYFPTGGMEDLINSLEEGETDTFMWERFMLRPAVTEKRVKYIGYTVTPWPCFMIATRKDVIENRPDELEEFLVSVRKSCLEFKSDAEKSKKLISESCSLSEEDANTWFNEVEFSKDGSVDKQELEKIMDTLCDSGVIKEKISVNDLIYKL
jgi:sulfonate transport system substrate-binding protein